MTAEEITALSPQSLNSFDLSRFPIPLQVGQFRLGTRGFLKMGEPFGSKKIDNVRGMR